MNASTGSEREKENQTFWLQLCWLNSYTQSASSMSRTGNDVSLHPLAKISAPVEYWTKIYKSLVNHNWWNNGSLIWLRLFVLPAKLDTRFCFSKLEDEFLLSSISSSTRLWIKLVRDFTSKSSCKNTCKKCIFAHNGEYVFFYPTFNWRSRTNLDIVCAHITKNGFTKYFEL